MRKLTTEIFIERARGIHGDKYDYSKVEYKDNKTKVCIICPIHGEFWQNPASHLQGCGCNLCGNKITKQKQTLTTEQFIEKARKVHGDKYDYSKVKYIDSRTKVCIVCPTHGEFWQNPASHLHGIGCSYCAKNNKKTTEEFIVDACKIHGDKYDYSKVKYKNALTKVCIICSIHGEFWQTPKDHLRGKGCPICGGNIKLSTKDFIERARKVHGNTYDYSKVDYNGMETKVCIICPRHGEFWQTPHNHLKYGCFKCKNSKLEKEVRDILEKHNIKYEEQKTFDWLKYKQNMYLDFYLPDYNIGIECQGEQHFVKYRFEENNDKLELRQTRDKVKKFLCENVYNIKVLYYGKINNLITNEEKLINRIYESVEM
jgi:hypothetical protein